MEKESRSRQNGSASRSPTPVKSRRSKFSRSRSPRRKHSKRYSPSRSRSRSWRRYSRDRYSRSHSRRNRRHRSPTRSPQSRRRRHHGDRRNHSAIAASKDNPKESRCLGVFGLSLQTDERTLRDIFERYGPVEEVQIVYDYHTGRSRGFGFVYLKYIEDAIDAKESVPGMDVDGKKIRVDYSITERAHTPTPGTYLGYGGGAPKGRSNRSPSPRGKYRSYSRSPSRGRY